jgi:uncharacterized protein (DUF58 family)
MIPSELAAKVRLLQIHTRKRVTDSLAGAYHSAFRGRGIEFAEVREYVPGDDIRTIDWNVTARSGRPYVKRFTEERELTLLFVVDASGSARFGSQGRSKLEVAAELYALLAFSAIRNKDKCGLVVFTDEVELYVPARRGSGHVLLLVRDLLAFRPARKQTDITAALEFTGRVTHSKAVVFLVSDFAAQGYEPALRVFARRHDVIAVELCDPREDELPDAGLIELEDSESGERYTVDSADPHVRSSFAAAAFKRRAALIRFLRSASVDYLRIAAGSDYLQELLRFCRARAKRN